jgi:hypothetical protein
MSYVDELLWIDLQIAAARGETCRSCAHHYPLRKVDMLGKHIGPGGPPGCRKGVGPADINDNCTLWEPKAAATAPTAA